MSDILNKFHNLKVNRSGERRAPHKPLLVLLALARFQQGQKKIRFDEIKTELLSLLNAYAPPANRHQPELPFWHLQGDEIWTVDNAEDLPRQQGGFPKLGAIKETSAGFTDEVIARLQASPDKVASIVFDILVEHFPASIHEDLIAQTGIQVEPAEAVAEETPEYKAARKRDPSFRNQVLRAYEYRCAVTGFRAALGGSFFGCEAAHVKWHAYNGPDSVSNGICLEPTIHKLFDVGAWTLSDDLRILVSKEYTGSDSAINRLREHHGQHLIGPLKGEPPVSIEFARWHRESALGGVFRGPALDL